MAAKYKFTTKERDESTDLDYFGARFYDSDICRWLQVDPLSDIYESWSSYNYVSNNPISKVDPDGRKVNIIGEDASAVVEQMQKKTNLTLELDKETGKLSYSLIQEGPAALTDNDRALMQAIDDQGVVVNLYVTSSSWYTSNDAQGADWPIMMGGYDGSIIMNPGDINQVVQTTQIFNLDISLKMEKAGMDVPGDAAMHEIKESYFGGLLFPNTGYTRYNDAHNIASASDYFKPTWSMEDNTNPNTGVKSFYVYDKGCYIKLTDTNSKKDNILTK